MTTAIHQYEDPAKLEEDTLERHHERASTILAAAKNAHYQVDIFA